MTTYKAVALGSTGDLVGDDNGLQDVAVLVEVFFHAFLGSFPG